MTEKNGGIPEFHRKRPFLKRIKSCDTGEVEVGTLLLGNNKNNVMPIKY